MWSAHVRPHECSAVPSFGKAHLSCLQCTPDDMRSLNKFVLL